jgi:hypothetical protein
MALVRQTILVTLAGGPSPSSVVRPHLVPFRRALADRRARVVK